MKGLVIVAALLTFTLAGCFGAPEPPEDASVATDDALPGLTLSAWTLEVGGRTRMHALVENAGPHNYDIFVACGEPWRSRIISPTGEEIHFVEVQEEPACAKYRDVLRAKTDIDVLYSWNHRDHDVKNSTSTPVAPGLYDWVLQFTLRGSDAVLETHIPIRVSGDGSGPLSDFTMDLATGTLPGAHGVNVTVRNGGTEAPTFWTGCGMEWHVRILDKDGNEVPQRPQPSCDGFRDTTFPPEHRVYAEFFWNGTTYAGDAYHIVPSGVYQWEITFGLQGTSATQEPKFTRTASFTV